MTKSTMYEAPQGSRAGAARRIMADYHCKLCNKTHYGSAKVYETCDEEWYDLHPEEKPKLTVYKPTQEQIEFGEAFLKEAKRTLEQVHATEGACDSAGVAALVVEACKYMKPWQFEVRRVTDYNGGTINVTYYIERRK